MNIAPFGKQLLAWRRYRGLTQHRLAEKARLPRPNISDLECGRYDPSLATIRKLAFALNLNLGELLESQPPLADLGRQEIDILAREVARQAEESLWLPKALRAARKRFFQSKKWRQVARQLAKIMAHRHAAANPKSSRAVKEGQGIRLARYLKVDFGDDLWKTLETRIQRYNA